MHPTDRFSTHSVTNQPPPLAPYDAYATDLPLREALAREGGAWAEPAIADYGVLAGGDRVEFGRLANESRPRLQTVDRYDQRIDETDFHPAAQPRRALCVAR